MGREEILLQCYICVDKDKVDKIDKVMQYCPDTRVSFSAVLSRMNQAPKVKWIDRGENETDCQYMARTQRLGCAKKAPLAFRIGGKACAGRKGIENNEQKPLAWEAQGVPHRWTMCVAA